MKAFGPKKIQIPCRESKVPNQKSPIWHFSDDAASLPFLFFFLNMISNNLLTIFLDVMSDPNQTLQQYTRGFGHPPLIGALSRLYTKLLNRPTDINPNTEVLVTVINLVCSSFLLTYLLTLAQALVQFCLKLIGAVEGSATTVSFGMWSHLNVIYTHSVL